MVVFLTRDFGTGFDKTSGAIRLASRSLVSRVHRIILVVVEDGLGAYIRVGEWYLFNIVLILVIVEYGFGDTKRLLCGETVKSLNPCCSGRWSRSCVNLVPRVKKTLS